MQKLYSSLDLVFLRLLQAKLNDNGIECLIKNEQPPLAGEIPPSVAWPELWVIQDEQYPQTEKILQKELINMTEPKMKWRCPQCLEYLEGQFNICWNCGYSKST